MTKVNPINSIFNTKGATDAEAPGAITIQKGDTVTKLAKRFDMTPAEFRKWVGLKDNNIKLGQVIVPPTHTVKKGDSLYKIAKTYNMDVETLKKMNGLKGDEISIGAPLYICKGKKQDKNSVTSNTTNNPEPNKTQTTSPTENPTNSTPAGNVKVNIPGKHLTAEELRTGAIASGKQEALAEYKKYCKANGLKYDPKDLDLSPLNRYPLPVLDKNNKIVPYETPLLKPTGKPNGKVVILNAGHGGYNCRNGFYDPGAFGFIKKANGKYAPIMEYEKMRDYAEKAAEELRAKGYAVIITQSHSKTMSSNECPEKWVNALRSGAHGPKYGLDDISFISLHTDASFTGAGTSVCYEPSTNMDKTFANVISENLDDEEWINSKTSKRPKGTKLAVHVLNHTPSIPSALIEVEFINGKKSGNIESANFQKQFINGMIDGLDDYYNFK